MFSTSIFLSLLFELKKIVLKNKVVSVIILAFVILLLILFYQRGLINKKNAVIERQKKEIIVAAHNLQAASDTIRLVTDNAGKIEADKLAFLFEKVSDLEKVNTELAREVKETKGKVNQISNIGFKVIHDTIDLTVKSDIKDSTLKSDFSFNKTFSTGNYRILEGFTSYNLITKQSDGSLTKDEIGIKITTGIKNLEIGKPEIFVKSDYPGFNVTQIEGAVLDNNLFKDNKKKKVPLITIGAGIGFVPVLYDFKDKTFEFSYQKIGLSLGVNVNLLKLLK